MELWDPEMHEFELAVPRPAPQKAPRRRASRGFASASVAMSDSVMPKSSGSFPAPPPKPKVSYQAWVAQSACSHAQVAGLLLATHDLCAHTASSPGCVFYYPFLARLGCKATPQLQGSPTRRRLTEGARQRAGQVDTKPASDILAGAVARAASQGTIHPLDTLKVRMQARGGASGGVSKFGRLVPPAGARPLCTPGSAASALLTRHMKCSAAAAATARARAAHQCKLAVASRGARLLSGNVLSGKWTAVEPPLAAALRQRRQDIWCLG